MSTDLPPLTIEFVGRLWCKEFFAFGLLLAFILVVIAFCNDVIVSTLRQFWGPPLGPNTRMVLALLLTLVELAIFGYANDYNQPTPEPPDIGWG